MSLRLFAGERWGAPCWRSSGSSGRRSFSIPLARADGAAKAAARRTTANDRVVRGMRLLASSVRRAGRAAGRGLRGVGLLAGRSVDRGGGGGGGADADGAGVGDLLAHDVVVADG